MLPLPWWPGRRWGAGATCPVSSPPGPRRRGGREAAAGRTHREARRGQRHAPCPPGSGFRWAQPQRAGAGGCRGPCREGGRWSRGCSPRPLQAPGPSLRFSSTGGRSPRSHKGKAARGQRVTPPPAQLQAAEPGAGLTPPEQGRSSPCGLVPAQWAPQPPPTGDAALPHAIPSPRRPGTSSTPQSPRTPRCGQGGGPGPFPLSDPWCFISVPTGPWGLLE